MLRKLMMLLMSAGSYVTSTSVLLKESYECPHFHGFDGVVNGAVSCHQDHLGAWRAVLHFLQEIQAADDRHPQASNHHAIVTFLDLLERFNSAPGRRSRKARALDGFVHRNQHLRLVVNNQNVLLGHDLNFLSLSLVSRLWSLVFQLRPSNFDLSHSLFPVLPATRW